MSAMTTETSAMARETEFETVIGLEVHVQLRTNSKMFCRCPANYQDARPTPTSAPSAKGCRVPCPSSTARQWSGRSRRVWHSVCRSRSCRNSIVRTTRIPTLVKGYQISQFDMPLTGAWPSRYRIRGREQTSGYYAGPSGGRHGAALASHERGRRELLVDRLEPQRRSLMEIVSEPDIRSADEAHAYLVSLRQIPALPGRQHG